MNGLSKFASDNAWKILGVFAAALLAWGAMNAKIDTIEAKAQENQERIRELSVLIERTIVLEEADKTVKDDIAEIKTDIRDIKDTLDLQ